MARPAATRTRRAARRASASSPPERCEKKIRAAKRATRSGSPSAAASGKHGYAYDPVLSADGLGDEIERISAKDVSVEEFIERFERPCRPCVITDAMEGWAANSEWTYDKLRAKFGRHKFKVGSDDDGYAVRLKFNHIHHYVNDPAHMRDDSPLYIFDGSFGDKEGSQPLLKDYDVPKYFQGGSLQARGREAPSAVQVGGHRPTAKRQQRARRPAGHQRVERAHLEPVGAVPAKRGPDQTRLEAEGHRSGRRVGDLVPTDVPEDPRQGVDRGARFPETHGLRAEARGDHVRPDGWWHAVLNLDHTVLGDTKRGDHSALPQGLEDDEARAAEDERAVAQEAANGAPGSRGGG